MGKKKSAKAAKERAAHQLVMKWLPVVDASGRTHMEAVWIDAATRQTHATSAA